jgi:ABC-type multidrug transport system fused ATPase/permease subunit
MKGSALQRARRFRRAPLDRASVYVVGIVSACLAPMLVLLLGLLVQLKVERDGAAAPNDWVLGPLLDGNLIGLPWTENADTLLLILLGVGVGLAVLESLAQLVYHQAAERAAVSVAARLKEAIHAQALQIGTGDLLGGRRWRPEELFTDKAETVRGALAAWWRAVPRSVLGLALLLLVAALVDFWVTLLAVLLAMFIWRLHVGLASWSKNRVSKAEDQARQRHELLLEDLHLAPLAAGYSIDKTLAEPFAQGLRQYAEAAGRAQARRASSGPLLVLAMLLAVACLTLVVSFAEGKTPAGIVTLLTALCCAYFPLSRLHQLRSVLGDGDAAADEIFQYLDREPMVHQSASAVPLERLESAIELDRVTIADRSGHKLLSDVSLAIPAGGRIGLLASDPHTPLALAGLLVRFYDPAAGRILFDTHDIRLATLDSLHGQAALVGLRSLLFTGTVSDNITCGGTGYTTPQITDAAKRAQAYEFVQGLGQGFATIVGEHGVRLDRSEALRVALARAVLREPSLLIVEEPPEPPNTPSPNHLDGALQSVAQGRTLVVLPNRLNTLRTLDRIYLFHEGKLEGVGTHAELLQSSELYRHLNYVRFNPYRDAPL